MYFLYLLSMPLLAALTIGIFGRHLSDRICSIISIGMTAVVTASSVPLLIWVGEGGIDRTIPLFTWLSYGELYVPFALRLDLLSAAMFLLVSWVALPVQIYGSRYIEGHGSVKRFMGLLSLFIFLMLILVTADNLIQLFIGWEGVGLCSYLLIGFWYERDVAAAASLKAFIVNRVGDIGLLVGMGLAFLLTGSWQIQDILSQTDNLAVMQWQIGDGGVSALTLIAFCFMFGAMSKSAQIGFHIWLPDAMAGPTPVSALIHAATMVAAGVFLIVRMAPVFEGAPVVLDALLVVGTLTAITGGLLACVQTDIKRLLAYSTCSQLGYMFMGLGAGAFSFALFHLFAHGFFKALLFLCAGSIIHAFSDEQDMRQMGGGVRPMKLTYLFTLLGVFSLTGMPFFAGFYSKEALLTALYNDGFGGRLALTGALFAVFLTALYAFKMLVLVFHGSPRSHEIVVARVHEASGRMMLGMLLLAVATIVAAVLGERFFLSDLWAAITPDQTGWQHFPFYVGTGVMLFGAGTALYLYRAYPEKELEDIALCPRPLYRLLRNELSLNYLIDRFLVKPLFALGYFCENVGDTRILNRFYTELVPGSIVTASRYVSRLQTGYLLHYLVAMVFGLAACFFALFYMTL